MLMLQQVLLFLEASWLGSVSAYLPYDLPGGPRAASFDVHRKMRREEDHQDPDLVIGQGPLHRNNGEATNKPIAVIPPGGDRRVPIGSGSGVVSRASSLLDALPGSIDPKKAVKSALAWLRKEQHESMTRLNEVYVECGQNFKFNDSAVEACLTSDDVHLIKARLRNFNQTIKTVEGMEPEAHLISKQLQNAGEEMKKRTLQEGEAKVILKSEVYSDKEATRQISKTQELDHKEELRENVLRKYVKRIKADKTRADDANEYALLTHEEFHVRLNGLVKGITVGDQLAKAIFDRTGSILAAANRREASAGKMSERADKLINTTSTWSTIHQRLTEGETDPAQVQKEMDDSTEDKILKELRSLDEKASALPDQASNMSVDAARRGALNDFGIQGKDVNDTKRTAQEEKKDKDLRQQHRLKNSDDAGAHDEGIVQKLHLLGLSGGVQPKSGKIPLTPDALAGLDSDELTERAQQLTAGSNDDADAAKKGVPQLAAGGIHDHASSGFVEAKDDAFDDDIEGLGLRTSQDGSKLLNVGGFESDGNTEPQNLGSVETQSRDGGTNTEASVDEGEEDIPTLPDDPDDAPSVVKASASSVSRTADEENSVLDGESDGDAKFAISSPTAVPPIIMKFEEAKAADNDDSMHEAAGDQDEDLVEDDTPSSSERPPSFRGLYRREQTPESQHFLHVSNGRENFGFQAISRTLGVPVKDSPEAESDDPSQSGSDYGSEVRNMAFNRQVSTSDVPSPPDPDQILRALEHNVEKNRRAPRQVTSSGVFEISSDN